MFFSWQIERKRLWCYGAVLTVLTVFNLTPGGRAAFRNAFWQALPSPRPTFVPLPGSPVANGRAMGEHLKWSIKLLDKIYIRHFAPNDKLTLYRKRARAMFDGMAPRWRAEINAMARASGVEPEILMLGNSFLDMGLNASGCRQIHLKTGNGILHSHNLDWDNLGGVGNYLVTVFRSKAEPGRYRTVHLAFPGMIGVLDIINEKGVALSFNQLGLSRGAATRPVFIELRDIAQTCGTFAEARKRIMEQPPGMPFCIGLTDSLSGEMAVFERTENTESVAEFRPPNGQNWLAADNAAHRRSDRSPQGERPIDRIIADANPADRPSLIRLLRDPRILLGCNIYSVIFDFGNNVFYLASGKVPAAHGNYRKYPLFPR